MRAFILIASSAVLLAACATTDGYRQRTATYIGTHGDTLLVELGPPVARDRLSNGNEVWTYYREEEHSSGGYNRPVTRSRTVQFRDEEGNVHTRTESYTDYVYEPPRYWTSQCETRFILGPRGIVRDFRFEGNGCVAPEIDEAS